MCVIWFSSVIGSTSTALLRVPDDGLLTTEPARLDRKIAALRVIEALRLHAAAKGGLPDKLDEVTVAPLPLDPATGKAFEYKREGNNATLTSRIPGEDVAVSGLRYRITLRK